MTRRRLFVAGTLAVWLIALAFVIKIALDDLAVPLWGNPIGDGLSEEVAGDTQVGQRFTAPYPGLYRIDVVLDRATAGNARQITFHLKTDPAAGQDLWTTRFSTDEVQDGVPYAFEFEPIQGSKEQVYYFCLESADSVPGEAIAVRYSPDAVLDGAGAYLNAQPLPGNLQFHTFYSLRTRDKVDLYLSRMAEGKPYLLGTKGFYVGLAIAYALALGVFMLQVARIILKEQEEQP